MGYINIINKVRARKERISSVCCHLLAFGLWLIALCACSDGTEQTMSGDAIEFSTNMTEAVTRATIDNVEDLKELTEGFGMFGYLTDGDNWATAISGKTAATYPAPDFMNNQPVIWQMAYGSTEEDWRYEPLKYWPNSTNNATPRYISFFAYAPYQTTGIPDESDKTPHVEYTLGDAPGSQTDLLYANCRNATRNGNGLITYDGTTAIYQRVPLTFHHALASLDIYVEREYDNTTSTPAPYEADDTKIFIGEVKFSTGTGTTTKGKLNLDTGEWTATETGTKTFIYSNSDMTDWVRGTTESGTSDIRVYELDKWLTQWKADGTAYNPIVDNPEDSVSSISGVIEVPRQLTSAAKTLILFPQTDLTLTPTVSYSFVTRDDNLEFGYLTDTEGSRRFSRIFHEDQEGNTIKITLEAGKRYHLLLRISAEHVSLQVMGVEDWDFPLRFTTSVEDYEEETKEHTVNEGH